MCALREKERERMGGWVKERKRERKKERRRQRKVSERE